MGRMGHISIYLSIYIYISDQNRIFFVRSPHHKHFGKGRRTKHVSAYIYIHIHTHIYIYIYICIYLSFIIISFSSLNCLSDTVQSIKTFLKINHISKFTAKAMLKISIQAKIIINETILLEQNAP